MFQEYVLFYFLSIFIVMQDSKSADWFPSKHDLVGGGVNAAVCQCKMV